MKFRFKWLKSFTRTSAGVLNTNPMFLYPIKKLSAGCQFVHNAVCKPTTKMSFGQPTPETHPHLLNCNELLPGLKLKEFQERRNSLAKRVLLTEPDVSHVILIPSSCTQYMTEKIPYIFRQNTDFRYLTGCLEPGSVLMMLVSPNESFETTLFVRAKTDHSELWEGPRTGVDLAPHFFGMNKAKLTTNLLPELMAMKRSLNRFVFWYDYSAPVNYFVHETVATFLSECEIKELVSVKPKLHEMRLIKSNSEQNLLRKSAEIASRGIEHCMAITKPGLTEHQLFATVDYYCRMHSAEHLAYPPVVASGKNANVIHYIANTQVIKDGDLVLMDAGCELHGYCSDITRTWPANGRFSDPQRTLYDVVLFTQLELIEKCSQQLITLDQLFDDMCYILGKRLKEAHILTKAAAKLKPNEVGLKLCPHHVGHYLGMDVHDTGTITRDITLKEGMLITIEPGVYVTPGCVLTKPEFHEMGIRIEDNLFITSSKAEVISNAVKTSDEIEKLCQSGT